MRSVRLCACDISKGNLPWSQQQGGDQVRARACGGGLIWGESRAETELWFLSSGRDEVALREFQGLRPERRRAGRTEDTGREEEGGHRRHQSAQHGPQSLDAGMESSRAHGITRKNLRSKGEKISRKPDMTAGRHRGHFHLQRTLIFLVALTVQAQVSHRLSAISGSMHLYARR